MMQTFCITECLDGGLLRPDPSDNHEGEQGNIQCNIFSPKLLLSAQLLIQLLLEKKCDLDLCDEINGNTAVMLATSLNQVKTTPQ